MTTFIEVDSNTVNKYWECSNCLNLIIIDNNKSIDKCPYCNENIDKFELLDYIFEDF